MRPHLRADLLLDFHEQEFKDLVDNGLDIETPQGDQHVSFELCSTADAKFLALLQRQIANNNTCFSLVSPDIVQASKVDPHLKIGVAGIDPYDRKMRLQCFQLLQAGLLERRERLQAKGANLEAVDWHKEAVKLLRGTTKRLIRPRRIGSLRLCWCEWCAAAEQGHAQIGRPREFGLILVDVLHLLLNCVKCGLRRYLRLLACLSDEFKEQEAYFAAFATCIESIDKGALGQLAGRVREKGAKAKLSIDGGAAALLLREAARWLASTLPLKQTAHSQQTHLVMLHLFRRMQHVLQIACSSTMTREKLAELKQQCAELQHGAALLLSSCDISPSMIRLAVEVSVCAAAAAAPPLVLIQWLVAGWVTVFSCRTSPKNCSSSTASASASRQRRHRSAATRSAAKP